MGFTSAVVTESATIHYQNMVANSGAKSKDPEPETGRVGQNRMGWDPKWESDWD